MHCLIDAHTHLFSDSAMSRLWLGEERKRTGEIEELRSLMASANISRAVVLLFHRSEESYLRERASGAAAHVACETVRREIHSYNRWGCELARQDGRFLPFIGVNPKYMAVEKIEEELRWGVAAGAVGVKIIPSRLRMYADEPGLWPVYSLCEELGLVLLSQAGKYGPSGWRNGDPYGRPGYFRHVLRRHPNLALILAHLGDGYESEVGQLVREYPNVYTDTSLRLSGVMTRGRPSPGAVVEMLRSIGTEKVLFGSNYPFANPAGYAATLQQLPLSAEESRAIGWENFDRLMSKSIALSPWEEKSPPL